MDTARARFTYDFHHDGVPINLWGAALLLVSLALLSIGATGICLRHQTLEERRIALILRAASLGFPIAMMIAIRVNA